jgi:hypothetical protein
MPVDPGEHHVVASAPDHSAREVVVTAVPSETAHAVVSELPIAVPVVSPGAPTRETAPPAPPRASRTSALRTTGWVAIGLGVASIGVGAGTGIYALTQDRTADQTCGPTTCPDQASVAYSHRARSAANIANVMLIGGVAVAAAGAAIVIVTGAKKTKKAGPIPWLGYRF